MGVFVSRRCQRGDAYYLAGSDRGGGAHLAWMVYALYDSGAVRWLAPAAHLGAVRPAPDIQYQVVTS